LAAGSRSLTFYVEHSPTGRGQGFDPPSLGFGVTRKAKNNPRSTVAYRFDRWRSSGVTFPAA
jgi:hypothetical protein